MEIPLDKQAHFWAGLAIMQTLDPHIGIHGFWVTGLIAIGKEVIWDLWLSRGDCDIDDVAATIIGGLVGVTI